MPITTWKLCDDIVSVPPCYDQRQAALLMQDFLQGDDSRLPGLADAPQLISLLNSIFGNSPYLSQVLLQQQSFFLDLAEHGLKTTLTTFFARDWRHMLTDMQAREDIKRFLRIEKQQIALLIAVADITDAWDVAHVTGNLSLFADFAVQLTLEYLLKSYVDRGLLKVDHHKSYQANSGVFVLGMGKLGAHELNYSSDIDLILLFDAEKITADTPDNLQKHLVRLTRDLIDILQDITGDGYVFRVDFRLRPDPSATPLALSVLAAESYYGSMAQTWERSAMIKARPIAGDIDAGEQFLKNIQGFIWRRHLDFAAIDEIHAMKEQINTYRGFHEIQIAGHNVKLGLGGIREIEFFAQTQQLIWGGRFPNLREKETCATLIRLAQFNHITVDIAQELIESYALLRKVEHRLQMTNDQQTHTLPESQQALTAIAMFCGFNTLEDFSETLLLHLHRVAAYYSHLFKSDIHEHVSSTLTVHDDVDDPELLLKLGHYGFEEAKTAQKILYNWHTGRYRVCKAPRAQKLLQELTPLLLDTLGRTSNPDQALTNMDQFLASLPAGVQVLSLLKSNIRLLKFVAEIMGDAPCLAQNMAKNPALLDNLITAEFTQVPPTREIMWKQIDNRLLHIDNFEETLGILIAYVRDLQFRLGVQILQSSLDQQCISMAFSNLADLTVETLATRIEAGFAKVHGNFSAGGFAIVALGKHGSQEMTVNSDLDLVFIYDFPADIEFSNGAKPLAPSAYMARLCQRIISALSVPTPMGVLYNVDMRLRPSGNAGPIAVSLEAFRQYQLENAWTWEHMALCRARVVYATGDLSGKITRTIQQVLLQPRGPSLLKSDITEMRERMRISHKSRGIWHMKHMPGGMVDIEFISQYLQLAHAHQHPQILHHSTLESLKAIGQAGLLRDQQAALLISSLQLWWRLQNLLRLTLGRVSPDEKSSKTLQQKIAGLDDRANFEAMREAVMRRAADVAALYQELLGEV